MESAEPIVCPLWVSSDDRFRSRHYQAWDRPCAICGRKTVVSSAVKRQLESEAGSVIVCEQCALARADVTDAQKSESTLEPPCPTCAALKLQEESAAAELAHIRDLAGSEEARRKWGHIFTARWRHRYKAHNDEPRGR